MLLLLLVVVFWVFAVSVMGVGVVDAWFILIWDRGHFFLFVCMMFFFVVWSTSTNSHLRKET